MGRTFVLVPAPSTSQPADEAFDDVPDDFQLPEGSVQKGEKCDAQQGCGVTLSLFSLSHSRCMCVWLGTCLVSKVFQEVLCPVPFDLSRQPAYESAPTAKARTSCVLPV